MRQKHEKNIQTVWVLGWISLGFCFFQLGCTSKSKEDASTKIVNLAIWSHYVTPELLDEFQKKTGLHVQVSNYASNEELLAKLQAGASGYDVIVPSDYMIFVMSQTGLLNTIPHEKITAFSHLDPKLLHKPYDKENKVSLPFAWGTTGLAYVKSKVSKPIKSWKELFATSGFSLLDDPREALGAALKMHGYSLNTIQENELKSAKAELVKARERIKQFNSEAKHPLLKAEVSAAHVYSMDALQAESESGGKIVYVLPEEGGTFWIDNLAIPKGAQNLEGAYQLVDYLLSESVGQDIVKRAKTGHANLQAFEHLDASYKNNNRLFPSEEELKRFEMIRDLGEDVKIWDRIWTEVKAEGESSAQ